MRCVEYKQKCKTNYILIKKIKVEHKAEIRGGKVIVNPTLKAFVYTGQDYVEVRLIKYLNTLSVDRYCETKVEIEKLVNDWFEKMKEVLEIAVCETDKYMGDPDIAVLDAGGTLDYLLEKIIKQKGYGIQITTSASLLEFEIEKWKNC